ncbi:Hypothetical predicted protein [Podarcis lilfordi]|uniref:Uncharacterized protein n=1 Tax=Podarcis lilfordi TaxID=74358 RepID=A0AA35JSA7_9SAUR|nr:Hypothetical predicted protein [Podarcis lilfordi]
MSGRKYIARSFSEESRLGVGGARVMNKNCSMCLSAAHNQGGPECWVRTESKEEESKKCNAKICRRRVPSVRQPARGPESPGVPRPEDGPVRDPPLLEIRDKKHPQCHVTSTCHKEEF